MWRFDNFKIFFWDLSVMSLLCNSVLSSLQTPSIYFIFTLSLGKLSGREIVLFSSWFKKLIIFLSNIIGQCFPHTSVPSGGVILRILRLFSVSNINLLTLKWKVGKFWAQNIHLGRNASSPETWWPWQWQWLQDNHPKESNKEKLETKRIHIFFSNCSSHEWAILRVTGGAQCKATAGWWWC